MLYLGFLFLLVVADGFVAHKRVTFLGLHARRAPSRVEDPDGPTPVMEPDDVGTIDPDEFEGLAEVHNAADFPRPIPHQPWRRGDTAGCEAPIDAEWRRFSEEQIYRAVDFVGGRVLDITWYLTSVIITIDETILPERDFFKDRGPMIDVIHPKLPQYFDPDDKTPKEIWDDDDEILYMRQTEEEEQESKQRLHNSYSKVNEDDEDPDEPHIPLDARLDNKPYRNIETRDDVAVYVHQEEQRQLVESEQPMKIEDIKVETDKLSIIGQAILDALESFEEENRILARHEILLSAPPPDGFIETQKQFNEYRNHHVIVETIDPFNSNRTLKGQIVDRNSMDLILNIKGRMVTVPLNFVKCVRLPPRIEEDDEYYEYEEDDEYEEE